MSPSAQMEQYSNAFLLALAAAAKCAVSKPSVDDDSVDWTLSCRLPRRPKLDIQLKCTAGDLPSDGSLPFVLKKKNYEDLRLADIVSPRILVVVLVPEDPQSWLTCRGEELILRKCALWYSLAGAPENDNTASVTIQIPVTQVLCAEAIRNMMDRVDQGIPI